MKKKVEILAPAGSWGSLKAAVAAGADAVYMGGSRFGARAYADNPDEKGLLEAIDYVHLHGRRLYMTVNTLFKEEELSELADYIQPYYEQGLDGVIVQDLGALSLMRDHFPGMELHASTQMTITSVYGAKMLKEQGCCRVVTSREMSLDEIRQIHREVDVEIESFVHGALCYCYSGQCLMSSLIGGRSGNRGRCAQPCRLPYTVYGGGPAASKSPLNRENEKYILSLKDLCTLDLLPDIVEAGVYSLKIEGRMKSPRYTAGVVSIYRKYVDLYLAHGRDGYYVDPEDRKMLLDLFDRGGFTSGYYKQHNGKGMTALKEKPDFREGNQKLFDYLDRTYVEAEIREQASGHMIMRLGEPASLYLECAGVYVTVERQEPQMAVNQPMSEEKVLKQLKKTGDTPFVFNRLTLDMDGSLFMPVQALNELRRSGLSALQERIESQWHRKQGHQAGRAGNTELGQPVSSASKARIESRNLLDKNEAYSIQARTAASFTLAVSLEEPNQLLPVLERPETSIIYLDGDGFGTERWKESVGLCHGAGKTCFLALPHIFRTHARQLLGGGLIQIGQAGFDGVLVKSLDEIQWIKDSGISLPWVMDASIYTWNTRSAVVMADLDASAITMPWELNSREMGPVAAACRRMSVPGELIVYGRAPMMVSAQCITKTLGNCNKERGILWMKDRTGAMLPVKNHCSYCYNTIYNPSPVSLLGSEDLVRRMGIDRIRLQFTVEGQEDETRILDAFIRSFLHGKSTKAPVRDFTRGHFKRGVE